MTEVGLGFCKIPLLIVVVKIKEELDIPEKTIDLPQFTDKLDPHPLDIPEKIIDLPQFTDKLELYGVHLVKGNNQTHNLMVMADANSIRMRS